MKSTAIKLFALILVLMLMIASQVSGIAETIDEVVGNWIPVYYEHSDGDISYISEDYDTYKYAYVTLYSDGTGVANDNIAEDYNHDRDTHIVWSLNENELNVYVNAEYYGRTLLFNNAIRYDAGMISYQALGMSGRIYFKHESTIDNADIKADSTLPAETETSNGIVGNWKPIIHESNGVSTNIENDSPFSAAYIVLSQDGTGVANDGLSDSKNDWHIVWTLDGDTLNVSVDTNYYGSSWSFDGMFDYDSGRISMPDPLFGRIYFEHESSFDNVNADVESVSSTDDTSMPSATADANANENIIYANNDAEEDSVRYAKLVQATTSSYVRSGPGEEYPAVGVINYPECFWYRDSSISVQKVQWFEINYYGESAWVSSENVELRIGTYDEVADTESKQNTDARIQIVGGDVNVRTGPGLDYEVAGSLKEGQNVEYWGQTSTDSRGVDWYCIGFNGKEGWVSSKYSKQYIPWPTNPEAKLGIIFTENAANNGTQPKVWEALDDAIMNGGNFVNWEAAIPNMNDNTEALEHALKDDSIDAILLFPYTEINYDSLLQQAKEMQKPVHVFQVAEPERVYYEIMYIYEIAEMRNERSVQ